LRANRPSPCFIQISDIAKFAIEEDDTVSPPSVRIYFEGGLAWYLIGSVRPTYQAVYDEMALKARIWLWIQLKRSKILIKDNQRTKNWPSWRILHNEFPRHLKSDRYKEPLDEFHPYFIERVIQAHISGEPLSVGPDGLDPMWMDCLLAGDLQEKYPVWTTCIAF